MKRIAIVCLFWVFVIVPHNLIAQEQVIDSLQRLLVNAKSVKEEINLLNEIAEVLAQSKPKEGIDYVNKAIILAKKENSPLKIAYSQATLGHLQSALKEFDKSCQTLEQALEVYTKGEHLFGQARVFFFMGYCERWQNNHLTAIKYYKKSLDLLQKEKEQIKFAPALKKREFLKGRGWQRLGDSYYLRGDFSDANHCYKKALKIYLEQGNQRRQLGIYVDLNLVYRVLGDIKRAFEYSKIGLQLAKKIKDKRREAFLYNNTALIYEMQGEYLEAIKLYQKTLELSTSIDHKEGILLSRQNLGNIYMKTRKYNDAYASYQKALELAMKIKNKRREMDILYNLAHLSAKRGAYDKALTTYQKALKYYTNMGILRNKAAAFKAIGSVYMTQDRLEKALEKYQQSYRIAQKIKHRVLRAQLANVLATVLIKLKDYEQAQKYRQIAFQIGKDMDSKKIILKSYFNQSLIDASLQHYEQALENYKQYHVIKDSLSNIAKIKKLELLRIHYKMDEREKELKLKNRTISVLKEKNTAKKQLIIGLFAVIGIGIIFIIWQKSTSKKMIRLRDMQQQLLHEQLQKKTMGQQMLQEQVKRNQVQQASLEETLIERNHELTKQALYMIQKRELLNEIKSNIEEIVVASDGEVKKQIRKVLRITKNELSKNEAWENFTQTFEIAHPQFFSKLKSSFPELTPYEIKLCALLRLNFSSKELALILNIAIDSVNKARFRLRKKLELADENLNEYLMSL